ncbi:replication initiator [Nonomuraea sp. B10E15]|uniref:replication initiator n=1 Tax=Nonomuraea sp. B10E15 TaxID=3153560 RepID=UPI00325F0D88
MITRLNRPDYDRWASQIRHTGGCRQPIHLRGKVDHYDQATGKLLHRYTTRSEPDGVLRVPCKTAPRHPLPRLRRDLPRRHLPPHPRRPHRRQRCPRHRH